MIRTIKIVVHDKCGFIYFFTLLTGNYTIERAFKAGDPIEFVLGIDKNNIALILITVNYLLKNGIKSLIIK